MRLLCFLLLLFVCYSVDGGYFYKFYPTSGNNDTFGIALIGNNSFENSKEICDNMDNCSGFYTWGQIQNSSDFIVKDENEYNWGFYVKTKLPDIDPLPKLLPFPRIVKNGQQRVYLGATFSITSNITTDLLNKSIDRYTHLIFDPFRMMRKPLGNPNYEISSLKINVGTSDETLSIETSEWYELTVSEYSAVLEANTVFGAMRGLETFSQLIDYDWGQNQYFIDFAPWYIIDYPEFQHRGIMIDTPRHWLPLRVILDVLDGMSYSKLNVLHWHLVDDESFPIEVKSFPNLWNGAFSNLERYTQDELRFVVEYARERGIRVIPEFDGPGHMFSWLIGYPDLAPENWQTSCHSPLCNTGACDVPIDPSSPATLPLVKGVFNEMFGPNGIFTDEFIHLGGDEVDLSCWNKSSRIQTFMKEQNFTDLIQLYLYYIQQTHEIVTGMGKTVINWEEVWRNFALNISTNTIINVWLSSEEFANITNSGFRAILSNSDKWYLDHMGTDFTEFYMNDPYAGIKSDKRNQVLGGTAPMWGEATDGSNEIQNIFPRAAAFSERLWNYFIANEVNSVELLLPRLRHFRCRSLVNRGIAAAPVYGQTPAWFASCFDT